MDPQEKKIIFILGMPRSGTTLTEQIVASHSEVYGAGELIYLKSGTYYCKQPSLMELQETLKL